MADDGGKKDFQDNQMPVPKIKHDWYQTETHIIVTILAKNVKDAKVDFGETTLSVSAKLPNGSDYSLELDLAHSIVPEKCSHKMSPSKLEIKLEKRDGFRWTVLEGNPIKGEIQPIPLEILNPGENQPPKYPSSSKKSKDWNKVEKEIEKQEQEAEEKPDAVNVLLQQIYDKGPDDVRRAMKKSFQESGGTVLSTNWEEVSKTTIERMTPEGQEWKSWDS